MEFISLNLKFKYDPISSCWDIPLLYSDVVFDWRLSSFKGFVNYCLFIYIERDIYFNPNKLFENEFKLHGQENHGREGMVMPNEVFKNPSNNFISNIKEYVDVTFATDDAKQLEAHNKTVTN